MFLCVWVACYYYYISLYYFAQVPHGCLMLISIAAVTIITSHDCCAAVYHNTLVGFQYFCSSAAVAIVDIIAALPYPTK